jgi:hypothetical protein
MRLSTIRRKSMSGQINPTLDGKKYACIDFSERQNVIKRFDFHSQLQGTVKHNLVSKQPSLYYTEY